MRLGVILFGLLMLTGCFQTMGRYSAEQPWPAHWQTVHFEALPPNTPEAQLIRRSLLQQGMRLNSSASSDAQVTFKSELSRSPRLFGVEGIPTRERIVLSGQMRVESYLDNTPAKVIEARVTGDVPYSPTTPNENEALVGYHRARLANHLVLKLRRLLVIEAAADERPLDLN